MIKVLPVNMPNTHGGPKTFIGLLKESINLSKSCSFENIKASEADILFVIGGSRYFFWLAYHKMKGKKVVQRLNGVNNETFSILNLRKYFIGQIRNFLIYIVRNFIADYIIYQSKFSKRINDRTFGAIETPNQIIFNGTGPKKVDFTDKRGIQICCIEGNYSASTYEINLLKAIAEYCDSEENVSEFSIYGNFNESIKNKYFKKKFKKIKFYGYVDNEKLSQIYANNSVLFSIDIDHACSNSIIEAMSFGSPIVAMSTGGNPELIEDYFNGRLGKTISKINLQLSNEIDFTASEIKDLIDPILNNFQYYAVNSLAVFERDYSINKVAQKYINIFNEAINFKGISSSKNKKIGK